MKLHQLKYVNEVANQNLNVSEAAQVLFTSQPGVSKQIRLLETELGIPIFLRDGKRLTEITPAGQQIIIRAKRILREVESIKQIGQEYSNQFAGTLTVATTHTQARYTLPRVIKSFLKQFPDVRLFIKQGYPAEIMNMVSEGLADLVIATELTSDTKEIINLPCYQWNRCALVLPDHPLLQLKSVSLKDVADYPIITYDFAFAGRTSMSETFKNAGLSPNVVLTALDSDVIKTYVELGLGVGLVAKMAFDPQKDTALRMIDLSHLFKSSTTWIGLRRSSYLRSFVFAFIQEFAPHLDADAVRAAVYMDS